MVGAIIMKTGRANGDLQCSGERCLMMLRYKLSDKSTLIFESGFLKSIYIVEYMPRKEYNSTPKLIKYNFSSSKIESI